MKSFIVTFFILRGVIFFFGPCLLFAVEYPVFSLGFNGGYGQSELSKGLGGRVFGRYSLEAYIPGFQVEVGYAMGFYKPLEDLVIFNPDSLTERQNITIHSYDHYPMLSGTIHLRPLGEMTTLYFGGGAQLHFISVQRKTTDRYWDPVGEKYQEIEKDKVTLLDQVKLGYHIVGGLRFALGQLGSFDFEIRQTFLEVPATDWQEQQVATLWGEKRWNNLSANIGFTVFIF